MAVSPGPAGAIQTTPPDREGIRDAAGQTLSVTTEVIVSNDMCLITEDRHDELTSVVNSVNAFFFALTAGAFLPTLVTIVTQGDDMSPKSFGTYVGFGVAFFLLSAYFAAQWKRDATAATGMRNRKIKVPAWTVIGKLTASAQTGISNVATGTATQVAPQDADMSGSET